MEGLQPREFQKPNFLKVRKSDSKWYSLGMSKMILRGKGQVTLPDEIRKSARLEEGDLLEVELTPDGILIRPQKVIDATQAWFWDGAWQKGEREADGDRDAGRVSEFDSAKDMINSLKKTSPPKRTRK